MILTAIMKPFDAYNRVVSYPTAGRDVRWIGNESGITRRSEWNVVPRFAYDIQTIENNSQQADDPAFRKKGADIAYSDLGSRRALEGHDELIWYPAEADVSIRPGWFFHQKENGRVRSIDNLLHLYYSTVGGNTLLLLNIPPDQRGLIHEKDARSSRGARQKAPLRLFSSSAFRAHHCAGGERGIFHQKLPAARRKLLFASCAGRALHCAA